MNALGPPNRTWDNWKKVDFTNSNQNIVLQLAKCEKNAHVFCILVQTWTDWKSNTKEKACLIVQSMNRTGGGSPSNVKLSQMEERIERICGRFQMRGDSNVGEMGFGTPRIPVRNANSSPPTSIADPSTPALPSYTASNADPSRALCESNRNLHRPFEVNAQSARKRLFCDEETISIDCENSDKSIQSTPKRKRFVSSQNQINQAIEGQSEGNELLKTIVRQNFEIIDLLKKQNALLESLKQ